MKLWSGRFGKETDAAAQAYLESTAVDERLVAEDLWGSQVHAIMLARQGIISLDDLRALLRGLGQAGAAYAAGTFVLQPEHEDVHTSVEHFLTQTIGPEFAGKLHTARSRNDQVLTDAKLYVRERILETEEALLGLIHTLLDWASAHAETLMPGYTHTQHAQPITLGFWASGYASLFTRDLRRLRQAYEIVNTNPLGACALAGTSFPLDRHLTTELLGFDRVHEHALDVVGSRDFLAETLAALALLLTHLSQLAAEIVWGSTYEFGFWELDEAYTTGSSIMPQKKNPDVAELTRGRAGRVIGCLVQLLVTLKGLPLGYHRDLQEDKPPVWEAFDLVPPALTVMARTLATATVHTERLAELADANFAPATELANYLVREHGLPFRRSYEIVGRTVRELIAESKTLKEIGRVRELLADQGLAVSEENLRQVLDPVHCVAAYTSLGGTAPAEVRRMAAALREQVEGHAATITARRERIAQARERTRQIVERVLNGEGLEEL
ncbi:MAG TPA: argininosuccinate lyase [Armatimonadetes bacterium]|nr:argininosuccinate lyase [Armatimonadota bacterium]